ncbi:Hermansky-Pudlak syndrome 4 protein isoform X2 [Musca autumnalis]|uniref:Hermansky-Pudlak syndrome 4 protein isoform X2 n=1 Tax=Musca autumnalis TaxID=221902 RepID=UPI003CE8D031
MAKETMIVFVYDTECLKEEADDPVKAVLYFHPSWVSDTQKVALCGQLMGSSYFLKDCLFKPRIIALQNGKFVFKEFGRFILAVGTDRNISDYLLQHRADLLSSLVKFYHRDLQLIYDQFALQSQYKNLSEKLYHIFETYLPILQYNGNVFQNIPKLRIPKTASNIFLEAIQTLQSCQETKGVLGGAILYHNKVVASQLSDSLTKNIILTDPLHIRTTAEQLTSTEFHIPNGVVMLVIYIGSQQYRKLQAEAQRAQNLQTTQLGQGALPFQYSKRKMKRDKSLIFTHIPEESTSQTISENVDDEVVCQPTVPRTKPAMSRPTHLPLRMKNYGNKELPESGISSINFDENDSYPEYIGRTSVCSTPMAENKILAVGNIMSICANPEDESNSNGKVAETNASVQHINQKNSLKKDFEKFFHNFISNPNKIERRSSLTDIHDSLKTFSKKISLKQFSHNFKTDVNRNGGDASPDFIENGDEEDGDSSDNSDDNNKTSKTITDPTNPVFNVNGQPISRSLFQEFLEKYYKLWGEASEDAKQDAEIAQLIEEFKEFDNELQKLNESLKKPTVPDSNLNLESAPPPVDCSVKTPLDKKALSLPLKSFSDNTSSVSSRKQLGGAVPLTPLMAKLSVLALNDERPTWDATPGANIEIQTPLNTSKGFGRRSSLKCEDAVDALYCIPSNATTHGDGLQKAELYICGQQNMTLILVMEEGCSSQSKLVHKLFDICVAKFPHMEAHLSQTLNINVECEKRDGSYSFMCIDSKWDALQRSGPWTPVEISTLESMHSDMINHAEITDLVLRSYDTVFYGYKSGRTEIFYKEPAREINGIPPPSDPMGNVAMRAKLRLEREHSYVLF